RRRRGRRMSSLSRISRRALLAALPALTLVRPARAQLASRVVKMQSDGRGVTATLELANAPFPTSSTSYQDPSVLAFIPHHHRVARDGTVALVVHFHGHRTTAERAIVAHELREQLHDSKQNAILLVPQLAVMAPDSSCGRIEAQNGFARMVDDAL